MNQVRTGIEGLDSILNGGIPEGSIIELSGVPGSGKTVLSLHLLTKSSLPGLFVSFEQTEEQLKRQIKLTGGSAPDGAHFLFLEETSLDPILSKIESKIKKTGSKLLVIDSLSSLINTVLTPSLSKELSESSRMSMGATTVLPLFIDSEPQVRSIVWQILSSLRKLNCTTILTSELSRDSQYYSRDTISEFKVDGIILLEPKTLADRPQKTLKVVKMRYIDHDPERHLLSISPSGVSVSKLYKVEEK